MYNEFFYILPCCLHGRKTTFLPVSFLVSWNFNPSSANFTICLNSPNESLPNKWKKKCKWFFLITMKFSKFYCDSFFFNIKNSRHWYLYQSSSFSIYSFYHHCLYLLAPYMLSIASPIQRFVSAIKWARGRVGGGGFIVAGPQKNTFILFSAFLTIIAQ